MKNHWLDQIKQKKKLEEYIKQIKDIIEKTLKKGKDKRG